MNRFTSYLKGQELTKLHLNQALEDVKQGKVERAIGHLCAGLREQMVATNNIASLYFERRKKR